MSNLEKLILVTLVYFDIFDYPLTSAEIWRYLYQPSTIKNQQTTFSIFDVQKTLESNPKLKKVISCKDGFYFLKERENLVKKRHERFRIAQPKWGIARKAATWMQFIPFIKMIAVCNTLAYNNPKEESDIDFLIVVKHGRIWTVRFFTLLIVFLLGLRPSPQKFKDKICLSFYITDRFLNLENITIKPFDIFVAYWITQLIPLIDRESTYNRLIQANSWIKDYLFQVVRYFSEKRKIKETRFNLFIRKFLEKMLKIQIANLIERGFKKIQLIFMSEEKKNLALKPEPNVIISDRILKFHLVDKRIGFREKFEERYAQILHRLNQSL